MPLGRAVLTRPPSGSQLTKWGTNCAAGCIAGHAPAAALAWRNAIPTRHQAPDARPQPLRCVLRAQLRLARLQTGLLLLLLRAARVQRGADAAAGSAAEFATAAAAWRCRRAVRACGSSNGPRACAAPVLRLAGGLLSPSCVRRPIAVTRLAGAPLRVCVPVLPPCPQHGPWPWRASSTERGGRGGGGENNTVASSACLCVLQ